MINATILSTNFSLVKDILNNVDLPLLYHVITNEHDFYEFTKSKKIGLIFLDSKINLSLKNSIIAKYPSSTIIIRNNKDFYSTLTSSRLLHKVHKIINSQEEAEIRNKIMLKLKYLGYSFRQQGTYYLSDVIYEVFRTQDKINHNLQKDIYPIIAKKCNKTTNNIKSSIHKATECMYYECDTEIIKKFFHFYDDTKPTVKDVVFAIFNTL